MPLDAHVFYESCDYLIETASRTSYNCRVQPEPLSKMSSVKLCFTYHNVLNINKMTKDDSKLIPITMLITPTFPKYNL